MAQTDVAAQATEVPMATQVPVLDETRSPIEFQIDDLMKDLKLDSNEVGDLGCKGCSNCS
jgi:hypothetical protein